MIRLLIADDHTIVREGLKRIFARTADIVVAAEAANAHEVLAQLQSDTFDLLLLDMSMPDVRGTDLLTSVKATVPTLPVVILTMHNEVQMAARALKAGASGYIVKDSDPETLLLAIRKVSSGGRYIAPVLAEQMSFDASLPQSCLPHILLSPRELEVFYLLVSGDSVNEIAEKLSINNRTVSSHKMHLMEKMSLKNVVDLVRYALQHGLVN